MHVCSELTINPTAGFEDQWQFIRRQQLQSLASRPHQPMHVRSEFKIKPTAGFEDQWQFIRSQLLQS